MTNSAEIPADWPRQLDSGLDRMHIALDTAQRASLIAYLALLQRWNRAYNLTAVRDPGSLVRRHLLDSLSVLDAVDDGPVLDVGSGAGLPGIPLAIALPRYRFSLLDSNGKKTRFMQQAVGELGLGNVEVLNGRVESLDRASRYPRIISRAFASLADMVRLTGALLAPGGRWLAMKAAVPTGELAALPPGIDHEIVPLTVPGEAAHRHLVVLWRARATA